MGLPDTELSEDMNTDRHGTDIFFGLSSYHSADDDRQGLGWGHWGHLGGWGWGAWGQWRGWGGWGQWRGWGGWGQWDRLALGITPDEPDR